MLRIGFSAATAVIVLVGASLNVTGRTGTAFLLAVLAGLFALGASAPDGFDARQGTDLLGFLAHVLQLRIRRWLSLGT